MKKIITFMLLLTFVLTSCGKTEEVKVDEVKPKYVETTTIEKKPFAEELKLVGKTSSSMETSISPLASGVIKTINVQVGDQVKAGDILATIDTKSNLINVNLNNAQNVYENTINVYNATKTSLDKSLESARLQYENAITTRDNTYNSTEKQLKLAGSQLDAIKIQKDNTSKTSTTSVELAQKSLENAKLNLENFNKNYIETFKSLDIKRNSLINNIRVSMDNSVATFDTSLNLIDTTLGVTETNKNYNDSYEMYLSAKNTSIKTEAESLFKSVNNDFLSLDGKYLDNLSDEELLKYYNDVMNLNNRLVSLFDKMVSVLDYSITSSTFTDATLSSLKSSVKTYQGQVISLKSTLVTLNNSLVDLDNSIVSTRVSLDTQKATLEQAISIAEASLNNTKTSTNTSIDSISSSENTTKLQLESTIETIKSSRDSVDNAVKIAEAQYESAKASYNSSMASVKSQLDNASGSKSSLLEQYDNSLIKAPFDGIITEKSIEIGQSVSSAVKVFSISNSKNKIIKLDVTSDNIRYLQFGNEVKIEKNGKTATGIISLLSAQADETTKMFKVEISFNDKELNNSLVLGDFVDVYITKNVGTEKYVIVPFSSLIVGSNDTYHVYTVSPENLVVEKEVTIGSSNSHEIVILTGLKEGDKVITSGALNVSVGDKVEEK